MNISVLNSMTKSGVTGGEIAKAAGSDPARLAASHNSSEEASWMQEEPDLCSGVGCLYLLRYHM